MITSVNASHATSIAALTQVAAQRETVSKLSVAIDDCGTPWRKGPGGHLPPPPPPPLDKLVKVDLNPAVPVRADDGWCGTVPHKFPFPPPPPPSPWMDAIQQIPGAR